MMFGAHAGFAPSQWETVLLCNDVFHWLGASQESALNYLTKIIYQSLRIYSTTFSEVNSALAAQNRVLLFAIDLFNKYGVVKEKKRVCILTQ